MKKNIVFGTIITLFGASCWGACSVAGKFVMNEKGVDPIWMVTLRLLLAGTILLVMGTLKSKGKGITDIWHDKKSVVRLFAVAAFAFAVCQTTYFAGISYANAGIITAIQQTAPAFVLLWTLFLERRFPRLSEIVILIVVVFGAFMLSTGGDWNKLSIPLIALILALISAVTSAMYSVMPRPLLIKYGTFPAVGWGMILAGIMLVPIARLWIPSGTWDMQTLLAFGFVVIFGTVVAFGLYLYGITIVGPVRGSIYGLVEPVVATIASALLLHQPLGFAEYIGVAAILAGVASLALIKDK